MPWTLIIAGAVLGFALLIKYFFDVILEEDGGFRYVVMAYFIIYIGAALAIGYLTPHLEPSQGAIMQDSEEIMPALTSSSFLPF